MTYTESLKSGHIAVWDPERSAINLEGEVSGPNTICDILKDMMRSSDIYAVNAINQMIDSVRDL